MIEYLTEPYEVIDKPLWWHEKGLRQTASGYGNKLTTSRCVRLPDGRIRRIYCTIWSNIGTCWVILNKKRLIVRDY
jgi:hypothetical protein